MVVYGFSLQAFEYFLLVFARIASFMFVAPFFGMGAIPARTKAGTSAVLAILVVGAVAPEEAVYFSAIGYGLLVIKEVVCGLIIGYSANICQYIITYAGTLIDMDIGLSMAQEFDPSLNTQVSITGNMYYYFMLLLMMLSGMHRFLLKSLTDTFLLIPLGGQNFQPDVLLNSIMSYMFNLFILAFRIMLPIFASILIINILLGVMAKVAPQMNMFSVGMQIKVISGEIIILLVVFLFPNVVEMIMNEMRIILTDMVGGML